MVQAVRRVSVERGVDPAGLALVAFGGAGPLHACALADALGMPAVIVPPRAGVLSAVGLLAAPRQVDLVRSLGRSRRPRRRRVGGRPSWPRRPGRAPPGRPTPRLAYDCRYAGQSHELTVARVADFEAEHARRNGFARPGTPVEVIALRASARLALARRPGRPARTRARAAAPVVGPAVIAEADCTDLGGAGLDGGGRRRRGVAPDPS